MTLQEINDNIASRENIVNLFSTIAEDIGEENGELRILDYIPFPIIVNFSYDRQLSIRVSNEQNDEIGYIHFSNNSVIIDSLNWTESLISAYLKDVDVDDFRSGTDVKLKQDYFVVRRDRLTDYLHNYEQTSGIWGGFIHKNRITHLPYTKIITDITALRNISLPTPWHEENVIRATQQPYAFERFLKNYHLLELLFDWQSMKDVSNHFTNDDFINAGEVLRKYERDDLKRLQYIIEKISDINKIEICLNNINSFQITAINIFYTYGKSDSNPLMISKEDFSNPDKFKNIVKAGGFSEANIRKFHNISNYNTFIIKLTSYWIYRIRSSIAHSKIGEYQLSYQDEPFMVEFAEPLLNEVITQCFLISSTPIS
jgi:hypothetical protein